MSTGAEFTGKTICGRAGVQSVLVEVSVLPILLIALSATPSVPAEPPADFGIAVVEQVRTPRGVRLGLRIANHPGATRLFIHLEPNEADPRTVLFMPSRERDRMTYYLKSDGTETYRATLLFPLEPAATSAVVVVGEAATPYRQSGRALDLTQRVAPSPEPSAEPTPEPEAKPGERVIARYRPPVSALGEVVLKDGVEGPDGKGWTRVYTDVPEVTLDQVAQAVQHPNQIWSGPQGMLFIAKLSAARAIALQVRAGEVVSARTLTKETFPRAVGPGTGFPSRIYLGR